MNKALRGVLSVCMALALVGCGSEAYSAAQARSAPVNNPDRVIDTFRTPDNGSTIYLFCRNGDYYVYMDGYKSGSINQYHNDERCK
jgi:hypothetical protein